MRRLLIPIIVTSAFAIACGRSTGEGGTPTRVSVGLSSPTLGLTADVVSASLGQFAFQLEQLSRQPQCNGGACLWVAEGVMPERKIIEMRRHRDPAFLVVFADPLPEGGVLKTNSAPAPR